MLMLAFTGFSCSRGDGGPLKEAPEPKVDEVQNSPVESVQISDTDERSDGLKTAVLAGGCFWCTEGVFEHLNGVENVVSGYAGGDKSTANYKLVAAGRTKHAEAIQITYDPKKITYGQLLKIFFTVAHDPTTLNRQGNDVGPQYRSAIFYENEQQKEIAEKYIKQLEADKVYGDKRIVTTLEPLSKDGFYVAESYHQDYAENNPDVPYIRYMALPKIEKLKMKYPQKMK
ncbi:peptide-methionine (S)-S-oxide reductase MsrA [Poriferisphaera corsica]|nr:peptide-methionine (S)-S-oxide reductase MsrA [Poriferisphaera corsica]